MALPDFVANVNSFESTSIRNHFLADLQKQAELLLDSLDGRLSISPDGSLVAWFGHPKAHLDDADRAAYFAQFMSEWMKRYAEKTFFVDWQD
ncbi:hypothetical protein [Polynucleobacter necessarius]|uniref:hypothetical protein n=1 Tax=Polynucleobacter necessarius TaxID=576610 RepID=UPI000E09B1FF|nr:hypothetical protein [Polynucleobacter necessarius]